MSGSGQNTATRDTQYAGIRVQTSVYGSVIPLLYGTNRAKGNLAYYTGFVATPHTTTQQTGKGGGSSQSSTSYTYNAFVIVIIAQGPISSINQVWRDKAVGSLSGFGFTFTGVGTQPQTPWATLSSSYPSQAAPYAGMAYVAGASLLLNGDATMPNFNFEVVGFSATEQDTNAPTAYDARPEAIIQDYFTNAYYGAPGWTAAMLDITGMNTGAASYKTYCQAAGFTLSPYWDTQTTAAAHLQEILDATNSEVILHSAATGMVLQVLPYGDSPITANAASYVPNTTPIYNLTYDDFITNGPGDPISISRDSTQDVFNAVPVEYVDRLLSYNTSVVQMPDPVDVALNGLKADSPKALHCITRAAHAAQLSLLLAQRQVYIRNGYNFKLGLKYMLLEPMDLVTITDGIIGFNQKTIRCVAIDIPGEDNEQAGLGFECEEWPFGVASAALYNTQVPAGTIPNVNVDPGPASAPLIFSSPSKFSANNNGPEVCIFTGGGAAWGFGDVYGSSNGSTYGKIGTITAPARYGTLTANLGTWGGGASQDNTNTLSVVLVNGGTLSSIDLTSAQNGLNLLWVDGEMISYQNATLTSPGHYNLTGLFRGLYGTPVSAHTSGTNWGRCDSAMFRYPILAGQVGDVGYFKVLSMNLWGGGGRQLSSETPYTFTPSAINFGLKVDVDTALATLDSIADDGTLSKGEKPRVITEFNAAIADNTLLVAKAIATGTPYAAYSAAFAALQSYILGLSPAYDDVTQDTTITAATWQTTWGNFYKENTALVIKLAGAPPSSVDVIASSNWNLTTNGTAPVIDGVTSSAGTSVLLGAQTTKAENGIYTVVYTPPLGSPTYYYPSGGTLTGSNNSLTNAGNAYDGTTSTPTDGTYASMTSCADGLTPGLAQVIYSGWVGTYTGTLYVKVTPRCGNTNGFSQAVSVYYSIDNGGTFTPMATYGEADFGTLKIATASLTGVDGSKLQVKIVTNSQIHKDYSNPDPPQMFTNVLAQGAVDINTIAVLSSAGSANYSFTKTATLIDGTLWRARSGSVYGGKIYSAAVASDNGVTLTQQAYDTGSYDINCSVPGKPAASAKVLTYPAPRPFTIQAQGHLGTAGTANTTNPKDFLVQKNGSTFGTLRFGAAGAFSLVSFAAATFATGDVLTIVAPAVQDATLADIGFTLRGNI